MNEKWFLRKHEDGSTFGPVQFEQITRWAAAAQIAPHDTLSSDGQTWIKAPMVPQLGMDWAGRVNERALLRADYARYVAGIYSARRNRRRNGRYQQL